MVQKQFCVFKTRKYKCKLVLIRESQILVVGGWGGVDDTGENFFLRVPKR